MLLPATVITAARAGCWGLLVVPWAALMAAFARVPAILAPHPTGHDAIRERYGGKGAVGSWRRCVRGRAIVWGDLVVALGTAGGGSKTFTWRAGTPGRPSATPNSTR